MVSSPQQTILYIEDDPASRMLVERALKHAGYRVLVAERGLEGIDLARRERPDLILTDINLPDLSGREITTRLRADARFEKTPIVALTAQGYGQHRALAMAAGVTGYLTKPVDIEVLKERVEFYLGGGQDSIESAELATAQANYLREVVERLETQVRDLEESNATLQKLDRMKDTFIQVTAHELRTPLTLVFGYNRLLAELPAVKTALEGDDQAKMLLKGLDDGIRRMQGIIQEIVTVSRIMTNQVELSINLVDPGMVAEKVLNGLQDVLRVRTVVIHFDRESWPKRMRADQELLALMLSHLLSNAIKYTPDGHDIYLTADANDEWVVIRVQDTGIGIDSEEQPYIFNRFHTAGDTRLHSTSKTAYRGGGLGLGLAVCKGVAEAHGGHIRVESPGFDAEKFPGSTFIVELPTTAQRKSAAG